MATIILKNTSGGDLYLEDFGFELLTSAERTVTGNFSLETICGSDELKTLVNDGDITINNGTSDLSVSDGLAAIKIETQYEDEDNDPTPSGWIVSATAPSSPSDGDGWFNTSHGELYLYDATRSKWLSAARLTVTLTRKGRLKNKYAVNGRVGNDEAVGAKFPRNTTLVGIAVTSTNPASSFGVAYETNYTNEFDFYLNSSGNYLADDLNTNLPAGDRGNIYFWGSGNNRDAVVHLIYAWRA